MQEQVVVHLIHGTWGRGLALHLYEGLRGYWLTRLICRWLKIGIQSNPVWTDADSVFRRGVNRFLKRLRPSLVDQCIFKTFEWSGSNSFRAREQAAAEFRQYWLLERAASPQAKHLIIAHSHGGMVVVKALTECPDAIDDSIAPSGLLTLATPFLSMETEVTDDFSIICFASLPYWIVGFFALLGGALLIGNYQNMAGWLASVSVGMMIAFIAVPRLVKAPRTTPRTFAHFAVELSFYLFAVAASWFAYSGIGSVIPITHSSGSFFALIARYGQFILACVAALVCFSLLILARAANAHLKESSAMVLRDTILSTVILLSVAVIGAISVWVFLSADPLINTLAILILFLPPGVILLCGFFANKQTVPSRRSIALWQLEAKNRKLPKLPCSLQALRLPGDEATLAIVASQLARSVPSAVSGLISGLNKVERMSAWGWLLAIVFLAASFKAGHSVAIAAGIVDISATAIIMLVVGLVGAALLIIMSTLVVISVLILGFLFSASIMALAVGPEVVTLIPLIRVDCEALPRCENPQACQLAIEWRVPKNGKRVGLRHGLYDLRAIQFRVAQWIIANAG